LLTAGENPTRHQLVKALSHFDDARQENSIFESWYNDVKKAIKTSDDLVQEAYLTRVRDDIVDWIQESTSNGNI